jgi:hypothetical protein
MVTGGSPGQTTIPDSIGTEMSIHPSPFMVPPS